MKGEAHPSTFPQSLSYSFPQLQQHADTVCAPSSASLAVRQVTLTDACCPLNCGTRLDRGHGLEIPLISGLCWAYLCELCSAQASPHTTSLAV